VLLHICKCLEINFLGINVLLKFSCELMVCNELMGSIVISGLKVHVKTTRKSLVLNSHCFLTTDHMNGEDD